MDADHAATLLNKRVTGAAIGVTGETRNVGRIMTGTMIDGFCVTRYRSERYRGSKEQVVSLEITDERGESLECVLDGDASDKEVLWWIQGFKAGRIKAMMSIRETIERALVTHEVEVEVMSKAGYRETLGR